MKILVSLSSRERTGMLGHIGVLFHQKLVIPVCASKLTDYLADSHQQSQEKKTFEFPWTPAFIAIWRIFPAIKLPTALKSRIPTVLEHASRFFRKRISGQKRFS